MHDQPKGAGCDSSPNLDQDMTDQRVVLSHVLALHPTHVRVPVLVQDLILRSEDRAEEDNVERAVRDLTSIGLLECEKALVVPTRVALHFNRLYFS